MAKTATRQVSIFINGKEVEGSIKNIAAAFRQAQNELATMVVGSDKYIAKLEEVQELKGRLDAHNQAIRGTKQGYDLLSAGAGKFIGIAAGAFAVDSLLAFGEQLFNTASSMDALQKKAKVVFGDTLPLITTEAEENAREMGLTNAQYIAAAAGIQDLLVPMGFQRKEAAGISAELVNLSGALSEWTGGQVSSTEVSKILSKALLGEREELKQLGISLSDADIKAALAAKGLDKLTGAALEQAKATTTLELILAKSTDAQAAYADGAGSLVRQQAEASAKIQEVAEKLATLLLPVFNRLISVAGGVLDAVGSIVGAIESVVDPAESATKAFDAQSKKVDDLTQNIAPLLGRYDELAGRTNLTTGEQAELRKIIDTVSASVPTAISGFDAYGKALGLNTSAAREFIEAEKARLKFVNKAAIEANEAAVKEAERRAKEVTQQLQSGQKDVTVRAAGGEVRTIKRSVNEDEIRALQQSASELQETLKGANAELARLKGDTIPTEKVNPEVKVAPGGTPTVDPEKAKQAGEKLNKELNVLIVKAAQFREDLLAKEGGSELSIAVRNIEKRYAAEIEKAVELEGVKNKRISETATAQRIALENLKAEEIGRAAEKIYEDQIAREQDRQKAIAAQQLADANESTKFLEDRESERKDVIEKIAEFKKTKVSELNADEQAKLADHYAELLRLAEDYFNNDQGLAADNEAKKNAIRIAAEKARNQEKDAFDNISGADQAGPIEVVNDEFADKQKKLDEYLATLKTKYKDSATDILRIQEEYNKASIELENAKGVAILGAFSTQFKGIADLFLEAFEAFSEDQRKFAVFQKGIALVQIAIDSARAISSVVAAAASSSITPIDLAIKIAAGVGTVLANIARAKKLLTEPIPVKQKAEGGALGTAKSGQRVQVTGEDDGRTYNATFLAPPKTGLLPPSPVVFTSNATGKPVLASERGPEYFIAAHDLRHPVVNYHARTIDLITHGGRGIPQFAEGGVNTTTSPNAVNSTTAVASAAVADTSVERALLAAVTTLNALLSNGIIAVIPDNTVLGIQSRFKKINDASGGFFG